MLKCGYNTSRMCPPEEKKEQRKPLQQDAKRIQIPPDEGNTKENSGTFLYYRTSSVYMFLAKMISIFGRK